MAKNKRDKPVDDPLQDGPEATAEAGKTSGFLPRKPMHLAAALALCLGGWLVPGMSHIVLGRWVRGIIFTVSVLTMFGLGIMMQGRLYDFAPEEPLHIFAFMADAGIGLPYVLAQNLGYGLGVLSDPNYDYGSTFLWVSGLLNYLIVLDAFDISQGRKP
jgi:hypothetical protein